MDFSPRRVVLFLITSSVLLFSWFFFVVPILPVDNAKEKPAQNNEETENPEEIAKNEVTSKTAGDGAKTTPDEGSDAKDPDGKTNEQPDEKTDKPDNVAKIEPEKKPEDRETSENSKEVRTEYLGSDDPENENGYYFLAKLTSVGASVERLELNDPRYRDLENPDSPLALLATVPDPEKFPGPYYRTYATSFFYVHKDEKEKTISKLIVPDDANWTVRSRDRDRVTFQYVISNKFRFTKEFSIVKPENNNDGSNLARDTNAQGYFLKLKIGIENLQDEETQVVYEMQGPVGIPLEDSESTSKFRDIKIGGLEEGNVEHETLTVKDLAESIEDQELVNPPYYYEEKWKAPFRYVGVDGQFFTTLLYNSPDDPPTTKKVESYVAQIVDLNPRDAKHSDVSLVFTSVPIDLEAGGEQTHDYTLFSGPKRQGLLHEIEADKIIEFGWFGWISKGLLAILAFLHDNLFLPYGLAIVCLTILVRGALFPLSRKQAHSAARMKELQPRLQELKKKYGDDKQKFAEAQMKLFRESGYNPLAGCLPMVLQLPIFIGLYGAIR
ncbi:MAG: YidC/Oxa1 family insertase periplasmic-domain containing protein, partial [Planctomycetaceae bacterium]|nr:YidC/Oxa1 family insertase periplasmic-domain containing protein [Planctomycetaceae bacterium]